MSEAGRGGAGGTEVTFELVVSIPRDPRYAETVRELAAHAARHAGCSDARAREFGLEVEEATRSCLEHGGTEPGIPLVFRRRTGPLEVLVNGEKLSAQP